MGRRVVFSELRGLFADEFAKDKECNQRSGESGWDAERAVIESDRDPGANANEYGQQKCKEMISQFTLGFLRHVVFLSRRENSGLPTQTLLHMHKQRKPRILAFHKISISCYTVLREYLYLPSD